MSTDRLRLLLIAPTCNATDVGESLSAYQVVRRLSERHEVTVLTYHKRDKPSVVDQLPNARVVEWREPAGVGRHERLNSMLAPGYVSFHRRARRWIRDAHAAGERFDLGHQVAPLALRYPSPLVGLGLPFVMGPVGGSLETPASFATEMGGMPWYTRLRTLDAWRLRRDRSLRLTYSSADAVIGVAPYVADFLRDLGVRRFEVLSEIGLDDMPPVRPGLPVDERFRLLFVGRVVRTKGVRDAVRAMALLPDLSHVTLDVVGDGEDREPSEREAAALGLGDRVHFHGRLPRARIDEIYTDADAFLFPSFREPSGNVVVEAMSHGLPLIVAAYGGPGHVVTDACGIRVPVTSPDRYPVDLAAAVRRLATDPTLVAQMGAASRARTADRFLWARKIERLELLYAEVLGRTTGSPSEPAMAGSGA